MCVRSASLCCRCQLDPDNAVRLASWAQKTTSISVSLQVVLLTTTPTFGFSMTLPQLARHAHESVLGRTHQTTVEIESDTNAPDDVDDSGAASDRPSAPGAPKRKRAPRALRIVTPIEWILHVPVDGGHHYEPFSALPHNVQVSLKAKFGTIYSTDSNLANNRHHVLYVGYLKPGPNLKTKADSELCLKQHIFSAGHRCIDKRNCACDKVKRVNAICARIVEVAEDEVTEYKLCFFP